METLVNIFKVNPNRKIQLSAILWFAFALIGVLIELHRGTINNYLIYKNVFWHTIYQTNLYIYYPNEYLDLNHYGPLFSLVIFPFAILPDWLGVTMWALLNAAMLFYAINKLPVSNVSKNIILLISSIEMMTSIQNVQFNPMLTAWLILTFICIQKEKILFAAFLIIAGFLTKVYGIAGIAFLLFSKDKGKFLLYLLIWFVVLFCLPMIISSPAFIFQTYIDWFHALVVKNAENVRLTNYGIDISVMGLIRRIFNIHNLPNSFILLPAFLVTSLLLLKFKLYDDLKFRLNFLSFVLISVVIFSSSAESPTYIIAVTGVAIWYCQTDFKNSTFETYVLLFVILITSLASTDLFPGYIKKHWIKPFSVKALPCVLVWLLLFVQLLRSKEENFKKIQTV